MAQSGLFVACDKMVFSPYNQMFTRILNNDNMLITFRPEHTNTPLLIEME